MANDIDKLLRAKFDELRKENAALDAKMKPYRDKCDAIWARVDTLKRELEEPMAALKDLMPRSFGLNKEISRLAAALGGKRLSD